MKKVLLWIRMLFYLLPIWITARRCRKENFSVRFQVLKYWADKVVNSAGVRVVTRGAEKVPMGVPVYFVSNHQGSLDPFIFIQKCPTPSTMVSKVENTKIPIISSWMKTMEMIAFQRDDMRTALQMVKDTAAKLKEGKSVVIYPEGTRSKSAEMNEFKPGALKPAFMAEVPVVPVAMKNSYLIDVKGNTEKDPEIIFLDPIPYEDYKDMNTTELAEKVQGLIAGQIKDNEE